MGELFANPFPGMNPYLESRWLWPEVHNKIVGDMHRFLRRALPFRYTVIMEERIGIANDPSRDPPPRYAIIPDLAIAGGGVPGDRGFHSQLGEGSVTVWMPVTDETVREWFITIGERSQDDPVTVLEVLSPRSKRTGHGRSQYLDKRERVLENPTHLVEIDLVRVGRPMPVVGYDGDAPYRNLVSRSQTRPELELYPFRLQSAIPDVPVPLLEGDDEPAIPLGAMVRDLYEQDYYFNYVDYDKDPEGPLSDYDREWLDRILREQGFRS